MRESRSILIIDDNDDDQLLYTRSLHKSDIQYHLHQAVSGEEGLAKITAEEFDCILLDYSLPGYNGVEVLKRIRLTHPFLPIVMLTGYGNESLAVTAIQEGAQNYIAKSTITQQSLEHVIRMAIEHCALQKRIHDQRTSLEVFTRALAHDLKEPVRTISSFADLITEHTSFSGKTAEYFTHIRNAAQRMHMLIETVFLYTQLDAPTAPSIERCDSNTVLMETKENLQHLMSETHATLTHDPLPQLTLNHAHLMQLFQNLLCNAMHHNPAPVRIHISAQEQDSSWLFRVHDNGQGITPEYTKKIFQPFTRLSPQEQGGAGLGLAICKKIIESYHGTIWCESQAGKGTDFFFTLPKNTSEQKTSSPAAPKRRKPSHPAPQPTAVANVLLVDDSRADIEMTQYRLIARPQLHCNLFVAHNGTEALNQLRDMTHRHESIDLVLLDINMPGMDGFEVLENMRNEAALRHIPVVMCSGSTYGKDIERASSLGAVGYLVKPAEFDTLKSLLDKAEGIELRQENNGYMLLRAA